jgi:Mrp family chromosome partitioning ATPase
MTEKVSQPKKEQTCSNCDEVACAAKGRKPGESDQDFAERQAIARRMCHVNNKILILSGKGGVGKSTVAVNLAASLVLAGKRVGILDIDIHGPSIPKLLDLKAIPVAGPDNAIEPVRSLNGLKVMSIGFFLQNRDDAVIWRGPMKYKMIKQFLVDVKWGDLDFLIVDSPPGTGDEPLAIAQLIGHVQGAVIVTTPQELAVDDVRRSIRFCRTLSVPVIGVVENMCGFVCPHCGKETDIFKRGGGAAMADQMKVPFLGALPLDPDIVKTSDNGSPYTKQYAESRTAEAFQRILVRPLVDLMQRENS